MLNVADPFVKIGITGVVCTIPPSQVQYTVYGFDGGDIGGRLRLSTLQIRAHGKLWLPPTTHGSDFLHCCLVRSTFYPILNNPYRPKCGSAATAGNSRGSLFHHHRHSRNPTFLGGCLAARYRYRLGRHPHLCPLRLLRNLRDRKLRNRLTVIFSTCLITTAVSLVHAAFIFVHAGHKEVIAAIVEDCVSLIVCNIPVVFTSLLRIQREHRRANATSGNGRSGLRFARTGWMSNFRWDRDLPESESEPEPSDATSITVLSNVGLKNPAVEVQLSKVSAKDRPTNESREFDHDIEDSQKKTTWQFQDG
ncbi:putative expressed protein [Lyophyllum shimeji]|uniref:Expressed protein n=1 Tax=Lyophyllum shimeji TaxID=47721 RepID=A0A9P3PK18_LYOSH|nr:putative expressed protein [Lyophyllum shimeji]